MYKIIWEFSVPSDKIKSFEESYGSNGEWAKLFSKHTGYKYTDLLMDKNHPGRYMTIDVWLTKEDFLNFKSTYKDAYNRLDAHCEGFTTAENFIGEFESIDEIS